MDKERLSAILFELDPLNTSCKENDCFDEYQTVAACTLDRVTQGLSFRDSLHETVSELFFTDMADTLDYEEIEQIYYLKS